MGGGGADTTGLMAPSTSPKAEKGSESAAEVVLELTGCVLTEKKSSRLILLIVAGGLEVVGTAGG